MSDFNDVQERAGVVIGKLRANGENIRNLTAINKTIKTTLGKLSINVAPLELDVADRIKDLAEAVAEIAGCIDTILTDAALIAAVAGLVVISICYIARTFAPSTAVTEEKPNLGNSALFQNSAIVSQWLVILAGLYARAQTISDLLLEELLAPEEGDFDNAPRIESLEKMGVGVASRITALEAQIVAVNPSQYPVNGEYSKIYSSKILEIGRAHV